MDQQPQIAAPEDDIPEGYGLCRTPDGTFGPTLGPLYQRRDGTSFAFRVKARHNNDRGVTHGGMLMTLADQVLGLTVQEALDGAYAATISLNCSFVASASPGDLVEGSAIVTRITRSVVFVQGSLHCGDRLLLSASGIWKRLAPHVPERQPASTETANPSREAMRR
jgi:uncharacterized protein (TIGR00369 family)